MLMGVVDRPGLTLPSSSCSWPDSQGGPLVLGLTPVPSLWPSCLYWL